MNGKLQSSDVKNETPYNIPLLINENVISSGISLRSRSGIPTPTSITG